MRLNQKPSGSPKEQKTKHFRSVAGKSNPKSTRQKNDKEDLMGPLHSEGSSKRKKGRPPSDRRDPFWTPDGQDLEIGFSRRGKGEATPLWEPQLEGIDALALCGRIPLPPHLTIEEALKKLVVGIMTMTKAGRKLEGTVLDKDLHLFEFREGEPFHRYTRNELHRCRLKWDEADQSLSLSVGASVPRNALRSPSIDKTVLKKLRNSLRESSGKGQSNTATLDLVKYLPGDPAETLRRLYSESEAEIIQHSIVLLQRLGHCLGPDTDVTLETKRIERFYDFKIRRKTDTYPLFITSLIQAVRNTFPEMSFSNTAGKVSPDRPMLIRFFETHIHADRTLEIKLYSKGCIPDGTELVRLEISGSEKIPLHNSKEAAPGAGLAQGRTHHCFHTVKSEFEKQLLSLSNGKHIQPRTLAIRTLLARHLDKQQVQSLLSGKSISIPSAHKGAVDDFRIFLDVKRKRKTFHLIMMAPHLSDIFQELFFKRSIGQDHYVPNLPTPKLADRNPILFRRFREISDQTKDRLLKLEDLKHEDWGQKRPPRSTLYRWVKEFNAWKMQSLGGQVGSH